MSSLPLFKVNPSLFTMGVELELQLVNLHHFNLSMEAEDFLRRLENVMHPCEVKPEITQSMIELNSQPHQTYADLLSEIQTACKIISEEACKTHVGVCGGGTHPFQKWSSQRTFKSERFASLSEQYGYLAKQFTVFGQHIHIGCGNGDDALYLCHGMVRYLPQFIALSAASPFNNGVDTSFDCSRLSAVSSFPLSGTPPWVLSWDEFQAYYDKMEKLSVIKSMKDFYWDIRPKPEFGTIEFRICDTPLNVTKAADLAAYAQMLTRFLLQEKQELSRDVYLTYLVNRFRASRYGFGAVMIDPVAQLHIPLADDILDTCNKLKPHAIALNSEQALENIKRSVELRENDASWLRSQYTKLHSLNDVVRSQIERWQEC